MDTVEAREILRRYLEQYRVQTYTTLASQVGHRKHDIVKSDSAKKYNIEVEILWDGQPGGTIRVLGSIDDGGVRTLLPLTESFLVDPI